MFAFRNLKANFMKICEKIPILIEVALRLGILRQTKDFKRFETLH